MTTPFIIVAAALVLAAALAVARATLRARGSRFTRPVSPAQAATLEAIEERAIAEARAAVADMKRIADTPCEQKLADADAELVEAIVPLVQKRAALRSKMSEGDGASQPLPMPGTAIGAAAGGTGQDQLLSQTKQMQELEMSFNLQYLQLQNMMQNENRRFAMVSNIMKTKHDTVKNTLSSIR